MAWRKESSDGPNHWLQPLWQGVQVGASERQPCPAAAWMISAAAAAASSSRGQGKDKVVWICNSILKGI